jgi:DNA-binding MurR/RpiR family transcriptional regulator
MQPEPIPAFDSDRVYDLPPAERRVILYLLEGGPEVLLLNAKDLGKRNNTSDATVIRAAQHLGYAGLADLRRALRDRRPEAYVEGVRTSTRADDVLEDEIQVAEEGLAKLRDAVGSGKFDQAVDLLSQSDRIVWRGVGPSAFLAEYAKLHSRRIGHRSTAITHMGTSLADELLSLKSSDAVVVLSYGPVQKATEVIFSHAQQVGAPVILITDRDDSDLGRRTNLLLECGRGRPRSFQSHAVTLVLLESLILGVAKRDEARWTTSTSVLNDLRRRIVGRQIDVDTK